MHFKDWFLTWPDTPPNQGLHASHCLEKLCKGIHKLVVLQSLQESRAKGLQTWTKQQAAAKHLAKQVTDPSQTDTNDWVSLDYGPQGLHCAQVMRGSPSSSGDGRSADSQTEDDCADDLQLENDCLDGSQLEEDYLGEVQPELCWADESQLEEDGGNDLQPEGEWACPNEAQPESVWADDSRPEDDCADHLQPEDNQADESRPEDSNTNESQQEDIHTNESQQEDNGTNESQPEGDCAGYHGDLALQNQSGCGEEEELVPLYTMPDSSQWEVDVQSELCLSLSSDEEESE